MIARQVGELGALCRARKQPPQDLLVLVRPEPALAQPPAVDDVADQVEVLGFHMCKKSSRQSALATHSAKV